MELTIASIQIPDRARKDVGDISDLVASIERVGLLHPIVVTAKNELVAGQRRIEAYRAMGRESIPASVVSNLDEAVSILVAERDENTCRKAFTPTEAVALGERLEALERPKAAARADEGRKTGGKTAGRGRQKVGGNIPQSKTKPEPKTRDKVGAAVGMSGRTYEKAKAVVESGDTAIIQKMDATGNVEAAARELREKKREEQRQADAQKIQASPDPIAEGARFSTIMLDPPWDWGDEKDVNQMGRAKPDYATIPFDDLLKLPVTTLAADDCHIYMWITNRSLPKGFALLDAWGFRYITALTWPKPNFGMGNYFRGQTEHILFGVRGSQALKRKDASTLLPTWKRGPNGHSSKPSEVYEFIESCSPGPYLEMFARSEREGWTHWGNGG